MSKHTRSLPIPIITLLNKNRELIYNENFSGMAIVGHALCVSKAKRTALACAHSEVQSSERRTVGFSKDPVLSAADITYGLLTYYHFKDDDNSLTAIEYLMDAFANLIDVVPELADESASVCANVSERVTVDAPVSASVSASVPNVSEARESAEATSKPSTKKKTGKRKSKAKKATAENEREALAKVIARKYESTSTQDNPKISLQQVNKEAHEADAYLRSFTTLDARSAVILDAINDAMMNDPEIQERGATFDETARKTKQICVNRVALGEYMPLTTDKRMTLMQVIYQKHVKGQKQDETANTDSTTQNA